MGSHPTSDIKDVLQRLKNELRQATSMINEVKLLLTTDSEFDGLSFVGGVKAVLKAYRDEKEKNFQLEDEIRKLKLNRR